MTSVGVRESKQGILLTRYGKGKEGWKEEEVRFLKRPREIGLARACHLTGAFAVLFSTLFSRGLDGFE